jgi:hypothetical protein
MERLHSFAVANPGRAEAVLDAYDHDQTYNESAGAAFQFHYYTTLNDTERELGRPVTQCFYDFLSKGGIPWNDGAAWKKFTRDNLIESFWKSNPTILVCPACDAAKPDAIGLKVYADADHYLPKSLYPFLSVHPANLVPQCVSCNRSFKLAKDPLKPYGPGELGDVFLPYSRPAFGPLTLGLVRKGKVVRPRLADPVCTPSRRLRSVQYVFKLEKRWESRVDRVAGDVAAELADYGPMMSTVGGSMPPRDSLKGALLARSKRLRERFGATESGVLRASYFEFLANTVAEFDGFAKAIRM